ncbi:hypothetical protein D3C78_1478740 [compost metagenome]
MPRHLIGLGHGAQFFQPPAALVRHQSGDLEPERFLVHVAHLVDAVVGVEREGPGDHGFGIGRRQFGGVEDPALHAVVEARHGGQRLFHVFVVG